MEVSTRTSRRLGSIALRIAARLNKVYSTAIITPAIDAALPRSETNDNVAPTISPFSLNEVFPSSDAYKDVIVLYLISIVTDKINETDINIKDKNIENSFKLIRNFIQNTSLD